MSLLAVSGDDVLAFLNISSVYHYIILLMTLLVLVLYWLLVTLLVGRAEALEVVVVVVSIYWVHWVGFRICLTLAEPPVTLGDNLRALTNNSSTLVDLLSSFITVLGNDVLTLLNISSINNCIKLLMALLIIFIMTRLFYLNIVLCVAMLLLVAIGKVSS